MKHYVCTTCGVQYPLYKEPPVNCVICNEERQYVNPMGQSWTTLESLQHSKSYKNKFVKEVENLYSITTNPKFAIGQNAYLVQADKYNVFWDCITYIDEETVAKINELGGIHAIALSHPHYYSTQVEWAERFDVPIYIHEDDKEWVMRPSNRIIFWSGESLKLFEDITLYRLGGHFTGGAILHWETGDEGKGVLLTGDIIQVVADHRWVSFMYSYPNLIPLPASKVKEMAERVRNLKFNRLHNAFHGIVKEKANEAVQKSAERYIDALEGKLIHKSKDS